MSTEMKQEFVQLGDKRYCYVDQAPESQPMATLLCLHGFPDQWYGWANQIKTWSQAGYRVIVPHMLGYGQSDKPSDPSLYSAKNLCRDLALLLDSLQLDHVFVIGHDWGALIAWRFALWYPKRVKALVALSVVYHPPATEYTPPSEVSKRVPSFAYQEFFADPSSTKEVENNLDVFMAAVFQSPPSKAEGTNYVPLFGPNQVQDLLHTATSNFKPAPLVISIKELERYIEDFGNGGMNGPLSYYRNSRARFDDEKEAGFAANFPSHIPVLFIYGGLDETCQQAFVARMPSLVADLKIVPLHDKGHWILREAPEEVNTAVLSFLIAQNGDSVEK